MDDDKGSMGYIYIQPAVSNCTMQDDIANLARLEAGSTVGSLGTEIKTGNRSGLTSVSKTSDWRTIQNLGNEVQN
jgi:hypothetical protein